MIQLSSFYRETLSLPVYFPMMTVHKQAIEMALGSEASRYWLHVLVQSTQGSTVRGSPYDNGCKVEARLGTSYPGAFGN